MTLTARRFGRGYAFRSKSHAGADMTKFHFIKGAILLALISFASACVVETPREGYWDREHNRYWYEHGWHDCGYEDSHCR
jgi:hypothetical protein